jgi:hypothetical protein
MDLEIKGSISMETPKTSINVLLETINTNKSFGKLIVYSLNTLKSYLVIPSSTQGYENAITILKSKKIKLKYF